MTATIDNLANKMAEEMTTVRYADQKTEVLIGDHVETRVWFIKRKGRVTYIPGISPANPEMNENGLVYVGVQITDGPFIATLVEPDTYCLLKKITFIKHDSEGATEMKPTDTPFGDEEGEEE